MLVWAGFSVHGSKSGTMPDVVLRNQIGSASRVPLNATIFFKCILLKDLLPSTPELGTQQTANLIMNMITVLGTYTSLCLL